MGAFHHVMLCVSEIERSRRAYAWLMPEVGYQQRVDYGPSSGWFAERSRLWIRPQDPKFAGETFNKDRIGLCEICFGAPGRAAVDALAHALVEHGFSILHAPTEYPYVPGYYSVFFADPDGIKLEYAHIPGQT